MAQRSRTNATRKSTSNATPQTLPCATHNYCYVPFVFIFFFLECWWQWQLFVFTAIPLVFGPSGPNENEQVGYQAESKGRVKSNGPQSPSIIPSNFLSLSGLPKKKKKKRRKNGKWHQNIFDGYHLPWGLPSHIATASDE